MNPTWDAEEASLIVLDALVDHAFNVAFSMHLASRSVAFAPHWVVLCVHSLAKFCASSDQGIEICLEDEPRAQPIDRRAIGQTAVKMQSDDPAVHRSPETLSPPTGHPGLSPVPADVEVRKISGSACVDDKAYHVFDIRESHHASHTESEKGLLRHIEATEREKELFRQQWEENHSIEYYEVCEMTDACEFIDSVPASMQKKSKSLKKTKSSIAWSVKDCGRSRKNSASGRVPGYAVGKANVNPNGAEAKRKLNWMPIATPPPRETKTPRPSTAGALLPNDGTADERPTTARRPLTASMLEGPRNIDLIQSNTGRAVISSGLAESRANRRAPVFDQFQAASCTVVMTLPCPNEVSPGVVVRTDDGQEIRGSKLVQSSNTKASDFPLGGQNRYSAASSSADATPPTTNPPERRSPRIRALFENDNSEGASRHYVQAGRLRWGLDGHKVIEYPESEWQVVMFTTDSSRLPVPLELSTE